MGIIKSNICVNLAMLPPLIWAELQAEAFTVQRNSKEPGGPKAGEPGCLEQTGWRIQQKPHSTCCSGYKAGIGPTDAAELGDAVATKYGRGKTHVWRIFMNNGWHLDNPHPPNSSHTHVCGWRVCDPSRRTFWPTRCKTPMEKEVWWAWFHEQLNSLPIMSEVLCNRLRMEDKLPLINEEDVEE